VAETAVVTLLDDIRLVVIAAGVALTVRTIPVDLALSSSSVKSMTLRSTLDLPAENTVGVFDCCLLLSCDV
jgi:hypothetical protein